MGTNLAYQDYGEDELWEEIINGEVVAMAPAALRHNRVVGRINMIFENYLEGKNCVPFMDSGVQLAEDNRFIPDFMIVCDRSKLGEDYVYGAPDLVVEVLSPSTAKNDRWDKKNVYETYGVPEYWIVSPKERYIEVYILQDGQYILDKYCALCTECELAAMTEKRRAAIVTEFKCHLYDDLTIRLKDIFVDVS